MRFMLISILKKCRCEFVIGWIVAMVISLFSACFIPTNAQFAIWILTLLPLIVIFAIAAQCLLVMNTRFSLRTAVIESADKGDFETKTVPAALPDTLSKKGAYIVSSTGAAFPCSILHYIVSAYFIILSSYLVHAVITVFFNLFTTSFADIFTVACEALTFTASYGLLPIIPLGFVLFFRNEDGYYLKTPNGSMWISEEDQNMTEGIREA